MNRQGRHPKLCQCTTCVERRWDALQERLEGFKGQRPVDPAQTVMVREYRVKAHFRRNPRHLTNDPALRARLERAIAALVKLGTGRGR